MLVFRYYNYANDTEGSKSVMTPISEIIFSGFVSKIVNDITDISKDKIKSAVKNKTAKHQNLESQIYNITVDVLNNITDNLHRYNEDNIFDTAEVLLKSLKESDVDRLGNIESSLRMLGLNADKNKCLEFQMLLYEKLGSNEYSELYRAVLLLVLERKDQYDHVVYEQLLENLDELKRKFDLLNQKFDEMKSDTENDINRDVIVKFKGDKKCDYVKNWNSRMFLHKDSDEKPITLAKAFIMPDYDIYYYNRKIENSENDTLEQTIERFLDCDKTSAMLITGVPGIGKSTITSWFANKYKEDDRVIILRFRDWESDELTNGLLKAICNMLTCKRRDLNDKILVLDGFDEIKCLDKRDRILNEFLNDIEDLERSKIVITSRPTYIDRTYFNNCIVLNPFNIEKIKKFYMNITGIELDENDVDANNLDVLGVPVILYMAIMSSIDITQNSTKPELYNRVFAEKGGIFDKFCEYDKGSHIMRNHDNIKCYLKFLSETAFKMFEKKDLVLSKNEYQIPELVYQGNLVSVLEFPIKHLFENTLANIEFIHKSIYEYFVSEYIYNSIIDVLNEDENKENNLARVLGCLLKDNMLTLEIIEFLKHKIKNGKLIEEFNVVNETFQLMLRDGMTYYTNERYKNIIDYELTVFANLLEIVHLWEDCHLIFDDTIYTYLKYNRKIELNLIKASFLKSDLSETYLRRAKLKYSNLKGKKLIRADLEGADLEGADLRGADLTGANVKDIKLKNTKIRNVIFDEKQVYYLEKLYDMKDTKIYFDGTKKIISYEEFCLRKKY